MKPLEIYLIYATAVLLLSALSACKGTAGGSSAAADDGFQLVILKKSWDDLKLGYDYGGAFPALKSAAPGDALMTIETEQIESYDWSLQAITLTAEATAALIRSLTGDKDVKAQIKALNELKKEAGMSNSLERSLYTKGFLVKLSGKPLYGGIFLDAMSQMAISYPVIRAGMDGERAFLNILPVHIPFMTRDPAPGGTPSTDGVIAKEGAGDWKQFPQELKKGFFEKLATGKEAKELRALIRNPKIRELMDKAGKLK